MTRSMLHCAAIIATSFVVTGCAATREAGAPDVSCSSFEIIRPSRADTLDTKRQVLAHNNTLRALCGETK